MKRIIVLAFVLFAATVGAQQRFDATIMAGVNMCQIDGDDAGSYNHVGLRAGVGTSFPLSTDAESPWRMAVELAYTQKGARFDSGAGHTALQYVEYTDFSYDIRPTSDFLGELLRHSDGIEVLQPLELREKMRQMLQDTLKRYE